MDNFIQSTTPIKKPMLREELIAFRKECIEIAIRIAAAEENIDIVDTARSVEEFLLEEPEE